MWILLILIARGELEAGHMFRFLTYLNKKGKPNSTPNKLLGWSIAFFTRILICESNSRGEFDFPLYAMWRKRLIQRNMACPALKFKKFSSTFSPISCPITSLVSTNVRNKRATFPCSLRNPHDLRHVCHALMLLTRRRPPHHLN